MKLLQPFQLGPLTLPNRIVMAPMTRSRHPQTIPNDLAPTYYAQRASAGLIVAEATQVTPRGQGYPDTPGIFTDEHVAAWRKVTDLVHAAGGRIFLQLWHVGRISHSAYHDGRPPVAPSPVAPEGQTMLPDFSMTAYETPHALTAEEIAETVEQFRAGAANAKRAGFDGVEIHGANGYLIDQFLQSSTNRRDDAYGGSVKNRARFLFDVTEAVLQEWDADRVGVRLSPGGGFNDIRDDDPAETFGYVAEQLNDYALAYLHVIRAPDVAEVDGRTIDTVELVRRRYRGTLIAAGGFSRDEGERFLSEDRADLVAYARLFLANPDLPIRFATGARLNEPDQSTFYGGDVNGYTDYSIWEGADVEAHAQAA